MNSLSDRPLGLQGPHSSWRGNALHAGGRENGWLWGRELPCQGKRGPKTGPSEARRSRPSGLAGRPGTLRCPKPEMCRHLEMWKLRSLWPKFSRKRDIPVLSFVLGITLGIEFLKEPTCFSYVFPGWHIYTLQTFPLRGGLPSLFHMGHKSGGRWAPGAPCLCRPQCFLVCFLLLGQPRQRHIHRSVSRRRLCEAQEREAPCGIQVLFFLRTLVAPVGDWVLIPVLIVLLTSKCLPMETCPS